MDEDRTTESPNHQPDAPASWLRRVQGALWSNRSKLWRTSPLRPVRIERFLILLIVLGLTWRAIRYALGFPIWGDEAFVAVDFVLRDFAGMIEPLTYAQIVPLLFMWANLAITKILGLSEWALRLLPFIAGVAALPLFWRFARDTLPKRAAFLAVGTFAAAYYSVRHANEVKAYSLDLLIALGLTMLAWSLYRRPNSLKHWIALTLLATVGVWCSYPSVFVSGGAGLLLLVVLKRERFQPALIAGTAVFGVMLGASFAAMYFWYAHPHAGAATGITELTMWSQTFPPLGEPWKLPIWFALIHTGRMFAYPVGGAAPASVATFALVIVGIVSLWRRQRALLLLLFAPMALTFVAAALHKYPYGGSARTSQYLAPAICLLTGLGLHVTFCRLLAGPRRAVAFRLAGCIFALVIAVGIATDFAKPYKSERVLHSHAAVREIADASHPGDHWIIFNAQTEVPYAPYIADLRGTGAQFAFNILRYQPSESAWAPPPDEFAPPAESGDVWLLAYQGRKVEFPVEQFEAYVAALEQVLGPPTERRSITIEEHRGQVETLHVCRFER